MQFNVIMFLLLSLLLTQTQNEKKKRKKKLNKIATKIILGLQILLF